MSTSTLHVYEELEQRSDAWFAARCGIVTASAVGALLTLTKPGAIEYPCPSCEAPENEPCRSVAKRKDGLPQPIKTIHSERTTAAAESDAPPRIGVADGAEVESLALLLASERIPRNVEDTYTNRDMMRGIDSEPFARETYTEHTGQPVREVGFMVRDFGNGVRIGYSPDGLVSHDGLIEIKSPRQKGHLATVLSGEVPAAHMAQLQCGLLVSGREWIDFLSFHGGKHMWIQRVLPDPAWHAAIVRAATALEERVQAIEATYAEAVEGLPLTERLPDPYADVELTL
jgi:hypothetical protein